MTTPQVDEKCPYCGEFLDFDEELGYRRSRIVHLVEHSVCSALKVPPEALPDKSYWEAAEVCEGDTWEEAAWMTHDEIFDVIDSFGVLLNGEQQEKALGKALRWLKTRYPNVFED